VWLLQHWTPQRGVSPSVSESLTAHPRYTLVRQEGLCWSSPPQSTVVAQWPVTPLTLFYSSNKTDYMTCGAPACTQLALGSGYTPMGQLCYAFNGSVPAACLVPGCPLCVCTAWSTWSCVVRGAWCGQALGQPTSLVRLLGPPSPEGTLRSLTTPTGMVRGLGVGGGLGAGG
jgi:hypothetical protein